MDGRTREYLRGRFGDYYRSASVSPPPGGDAREWGYIPWTSGGTTMVRHQSLLDLGTLSGFLAEEAPRHVYFSAATYDAPGAGSMDAKGWRGADLVFDLDADHLPGVDPAETSYAGMLAACKDALVRLLDLLEDDFGFAETRVVFSGGRGYHVHVRDESVRELGSAARREVVDYVRGIDVDADALVRTRAAGGTTRRTLPTGGGWGRRLHRRLLSFAEEVTEMEREAALSRLREFDRIGEGRAARVYEALAERDALAAGNVERGGTGLRILLEALAAETFAEETAPIDEPVTTDVRRLIRLPGSLHGGTGLVVRPLDRADVDAFDPLVDAVPARFREQEVRVRVTEGGRVDLLGDSLMIAEGEVTVREAVGVFLMARGRAEKVPEGGPTA
jgi:DNA primase small subunit